MFCPFALLSYYPYVAMQHAQTLRKVATAIEEGSWILIQNCHLSLGFTDSLSRIVMKLQDPFGPGIPSHPDFRLILTTEQHNLFPLGLLQICAKITNNAPKGIRSGLLRCYSTLIDQDRLGRLDSSLGRSLLFSLCFIHCAMQERSRFGPLGFSMPYASDDSDVDAMGIFFEKHLKSSPPCWPAVQYMAAEIFLGGMVTDSMDRYTVLTLL